jgi:hypothetical protein
MARRRSRKSNVTGIVPRVSHRRRRVPKLCGADVELGNFVLGLDDPRGTGVVASRALLRKIEGVSPSPRSWGYSGGSGWSQSGVSAGSGGYSYDSRDWGRKYLASNGGGAQPLGPRGREPRHAADRRAGTDPGQ